MGPVVDYVEYAVFAEMNDATYWDNASSHNYRLYSSRTPSPAGGVTAQGVVVRDSLGSFFFQGRACVWNYYGDKDVAVVFSIDGWVTSQLTQADLHGDEWVWNVIIMDPRSKRLEFAVRYRVEIGRAHV